MTFEQFEAAATPTAKASASAGEHSTLTVDHFGRFRRVWLHDGDNTTAFPISRAVAKGLFNRYNTSHMGPVLAHHTDVKAAKAREAFRRLIAEMRADPKYADRAQPLADAVADADELTMAKLFNFFTGKN